MVGGWRGGDDRLYGDSNVELSLTHARTRATIATKDTLNDLSRVVIV